ncbi:PepSY domain-containing protein [Nocardia transvalensis]|uniref:PepSY domain-containing protein n=1 Tax=Nocardia transvalensis TaxID=37333 RepID=UPI00189451AE|nr:PepSY domain-containing protein [Nocardia transvalensis]MBF6331063.1 PepSY domain-containing protein [Nocardia transvalensis]
MRIGLLASCVIVAAVTACGSDSEQESGHTTSMSAPGPTTPGTAAPIDLAHNTFPVSSADALGTARQKFDGTVTKIELEQEGVNGRNVYVYKVELMSDTQKYAAQLSADDGAIVTEKTDDLEPDKVGRARTEEAVDLDTAVPLTAAMDTATKARPGTVEKWKIEGKNGSAQYEFDIRTPGDTDEDYEVQVDAYSGQLKTG